MEGFSKSEWSGRADTHIRGLSETKIEIEERKKKIKELEEEIKTKSGKDRGDMFKILSDEKTALRKAEFALEDLNRESGQNLKKAA